MFGASQLWGKVGRAFLRVISERQYMRFPPGSDFHVAPPLRESLLHWKKLVMEGPPHPIDPVGSKLVDAVILTDGFTPDARSFERLPVRVGAVLASTSASVHSRDPDSVKRRWLEPSAQIVSVEMNAAVLALFTFADRVKGCNLLLLIDSEAVEAALIKGYLSGEAFWDLAFWLRVRVFIDRISSADANPAD